MTAPNPPPRPNAGLPPAPPRQSNPGISTSGRPNLLWSNLAILVLALAAFTLLIGLGTWQVQRLAWKEDLIATVEARRLAAPVPAPPPAKWPNFEVGQERYKPARVSGSFEHSEERFLFFPLTEPQGPLGGPGAMVFTPFKTTDNWWVLVNRGFVPEAARDPARRLEGQLQGNVTLTGLLRGFERRSFLNPAPNDQDQMLFVRDRADLLADLETEDRTFAPYYLDLVTSQTPPGGLPQAGETRIAFSNNHLQYAITWYGLAAALLGVTVALLRDRFRRQVKRQHPVADL